MKNVAFFRNISKTVETILVKKIGISVYKKDLISEHRKNYIFRDNCFVQMSVSLLVSLLFSALPNFVDELAQKLV